MSEPNKLLPSQILDAAAALYEDDAALSMAGAILDAAAGNSDIGGVAYEYALACTRCDMLNVWSKGRSSGEIVALFREAAQDAREAGQ